jgi:hypothetical protein
LAFRGKWIQRNFWIGEMSVDRVTAFTSPAGPAKVRRLFNGKNVSPPGGRDSMANPTKSSGGFPLFQFIATRAMPSPRWSFSVNSALAFLPVTWKSLDAIFVLPADAHGLSTIGMSSIGGPTFR